MLYELLFPLADKHIAFNLFQYITFRAAGAMGTALLIAFLASRGQESFSRRVLMGNGFLLAGTVLVLLP